MKPERTEGGFEWVILNTWTAWRSTSRRACFLWTLRKASFWAGRGLDTRSWQHRGPWGRPCLAPPAPSGLSQGSSWRNEWDQWWSLGGRSRGRARRCCCSNCCRFLHIEAGISFPSKEFGKVRKDKESAFFLKKWEMRVTWQPGYGFPVRVDHFKFGNDAERDNCKRTHHLCRYP